MRVIKQSYQIMDELNNGMVAKKIERCGRVCYKSEDKITNVSCYKFVENIIKRGHESVLEHFSFSVKFITDRSVTHELVRHRLIAASQESQRYVRYGNIDFIEPVGFSVEQMDIWKGKMQDAEDAYSEMIDEGCTPQFARSVLPNSAKTEIVVTANLREWRHILKMRTSPAAHPQIRDLMCGLLEELKLLLPTFFEDIENE